MSSKPKHIGTPVTKCRTKRVSSNEKKTIKGTFVATINIEDFCDETSSGGKSWMTEMESTKSQELIDDVFEDTTLIIPAPEKRENSSSCTSEQSDKPHDKWSVSHLHEDSISSPEKSTVGGTSETPEKCQSSNSGQSPKGIISPLNTASPLLDPILQDFEEIAENLSKQLYDTVNAELEHSPCRRTKKSKLPINEDDEHTSPETFRQSEKQHDEWSLAHLYEDFEKGAVDEILSTPERCQSPHAGGNNKKRRLSSKGNISPLKIYTSEIASSFPNVETIEDPLFMQLYDKDNDELECHPGTRIPKLSQKSFENLNQRILNSTRIIPCDTISPPSIEMPDDISSISCSMESKKNTEHKSRKESTLSKKDITFTKQPEAQSFLKIDKKKSSEANKLKRDVRKGYSFEALPVSSKKPKTIHSATIIPSDKCLENLHKAKKKTDLSLKQKMKVSSKEPTTVLSATITRPDKCMDDFPQAKKNAEIFLQTVMPALFEEPKTLHSASLISSDKSIEELNQAKNTEDLCETPKGARVKKTLKRRILLNPSLRHKTAKENFLMKLKIRSKSKMKSTDVMAEKSSDKITFQHSEEHDNIAKSGEITRAPSLNNSEDNGNQIEEDMGLYESSCSEETLSESTIMKMKKMKAERDLWNRKSIQEKIKEHLELLNTLSVDDISLSKWRGRKMPH